MKTKIASILIPGLMAWISLAGAQNHMHTKEEIGEVQFPVSTTRPGTQEAFNNAVALLYSFAYSDALRAFEEITYTDPRCAMAYWGVAQSLFHPVWEEVPTPEYVKAAQNALSSAKNVGVKTEREQDYISAIEIIYTDVNKTDYRARVLQYEKAMEKLYQKYPDDPEAAILYALTLDATASKSDKTYEKQKKAGEILLKLFAEQPNNPGIVHYIIHAYDYPPLAPLALDAARKYARIAPAVPHALHMPSHIFVRLGLWDDDIKTNIASANAAQELARKNDGNHSSFDALHAWDYMMYGYLQIAQDKEAARLLDTVRTVHKVDRANFAAAYALAAIPARYALERRDWKSAESLTVQPEDFPWDRFSYFIALTYFAKGMGAARNGDLDTAHEAIEKLQALYKATVATKDAYWSNQVEILVKSVSAWTLHAEGKDDEALKTMRESAEAESATDKSPVTPGALIPQRELLGDLLMELKQPKAALVEFETSLASTPNRFNGIAGAAQAAELSGDHGKAKKYYASLVELCRKADTNRPQVDEARAYLARN
jgi:hypothetical protein